MKSILLGVVAMVAITMFASDASAGIFGRRYRSSSSQSTATASSGVRSYSYEPGAVNYTPSGARRTYAWEYLKTDPRRYNFTP